MTAEIRTGAERSGQKGTAGTKKFKEGRKKLREVEKRKLSCTKRTRDACVSSRQAQYRSKQIICYSEMTLKGGMEHAPTINIKFYACCTFQKPQEDIDSSKCHIFK